MQIEGGFIVVGADDHGGVVGIEEREQRLFDEATVRAKMLKFLPDSISLRCARHQIDGKLLALIYVAPNAEGFAVFKTDGRYTEDNGPKTVFRAGDVFVRHGSASERWRQDDIERIRKRLVERRKEQWRRESTEELRLQLATALQTQTTARGPKAALERGFRGALPPCRESSAPQPSAVCGVLAFGRRLRISDAAQVVRYQRFESACPALARPRTGVRMEPGRCSSPLRLAPRFVSTCSWAVRVILQPHWTGEFGAGVAWPDSGVAPSLFLGL
jgi:Schlafen, AlbA_2